LAGQSLLGNSDKLLRLHRGGNDLRPQPPPERVSAIIPAVVFLAMLQGFILAVNFYLLAYTAQRAGVSVAVLASRLSVAIPAILAFLLYGDSFNAVEDRWLAAALFVALSVYGDRADFGVTRAWLRRLLPILVFFMFGCHFTLLKFTQARYLDSSSYHVYVTTSFFFAFVNSVAIVSRGFVLESEFGPAI